MAIQILDDRITGYLTDLLVPDPDEVRREMETLADEEGFPIVGPIVGRTLEVLARTIGAKRILELGSGYGYSAYWFARATGPDGEIHLTDSDPANEERALDYLRRAGLDGPIRIHVGMALDYVEEIPGDFDAVLCDIDKGEYPAAWEAVRDRIRPGGLYLADNVLWSGRVAEKEVTDDIAEGWTDAIREHNAAIARDDRYVTTLVPIRDGLLVALRVG